jgi:caa(3)-type oxidase subunit IV
MTDSHSTAAAHQGHGIRPYLVVFGALVIFTVLSFVFNYLVRAETLTPETGFTLILAVAVCKAVLVATYFMHLLLDWKRLYFVIIPVMIMGAMMIIVLLSDIVIAWHHDYLKVLGTGS